jgi:hypothetical protein
MTQQLNQDEIVITNFQIESVNGITRDLESVSNIENYAAYSVIKKSFLKDFNNAWILYDGRYGLDIIARLKLESDVVKHLQNNPLYIFLYEDIETAVGNYIDLPKSVIQSKIDIAVTAQIQYENTTENLKSIHCYDFEYIKNFKIKNNLNKVYVCSNAFIKDDLKNKYQDFEFLFFSPFLSKESRDAINYTALKEINTGISLSHKFWCGNWRYTHHRHIIASYLVDTSVRLSWAYSGTINDLNKGLWFDIKNWPNNKLNKIKKGIDILNRTTPVMINENIKEVVKLDGGTIDLTKYPSVQRLNVDVAPWKKDLYLKNNTMSFCAIVTESRFAEHFSSFSEKPLAPIAHFMPFVIVGLPYTLKLLKQVGFKTFSDFWDESYDQEMNNEHRLLKILNLIDYIDTFTLSELTELKKQMVPVLEHNYNVLRSLPFDSSIYN